MVSARLTAIDLDIMKKTSYLALCGEGAGFCVPAYRGVTARPP